ncbi:MAG: long-chain-fatty-acid--CoA ligase [Pseudomonadota bacterium]
MPLPEETTSNGNTAPHSLRPGPDAYALTRLLTSAMAIRPHAIAVRQGRCATTWKELGERVARFAAALHHLGLERGDRVAVLSANSDDLYALLLAVPWAGGVLVPLNTRLTESELGECLDDCAPRLLLVDGEHRATARALLPGAGFLRHLLAIEPGDTGGDSLTELAERRQPLADQGRGGEDAAVICYTGGTTGRAKGVILTHRSLVSGLLQWQSVARLEASECLLLAAPMFHLAGLSNSYGAMLVGGTAEILDRFDVERVLATIERRRVSYAVLVPAMIRALVTHPAIADHDVTPLRRITYGGSPIAEQDLRLAMTHLPATAFVQIYGQTETGVTTALMPECHDPALAKRHSAGRPVAGVELRIIDPDGNVAPAGGWGEICVRSPGLAPGYWNRPEETAEAFRDGWLHTGDIGYLDDEGFLFVVDRAKDMIISGGENVYSVEVERVLDSHPAVAESAIIGIPSARWGEQVHAVVRLAPGASAAPEALIGHCRQQLAGYKCPRSVSFRSELLPRNPIGKILKRKLREAENA